MWKCSCNIRDDNERNVAMASEIDNILSYIYHKYKEKNPFKILMRNTVGISKDRIQSFINRNTEHCSKYPIFNNKEDLKPANAK